MTTITVIPGMRFARLDVEGDEDIRGYPDILRRYLGQRGDMDRNEALRVWALTGGHRLEDAYRWARDVA
jgi:hypothetical protein